MVAALHLYKITLLSNTINNKTTFSFTPPQNHTTLKRNRTCSCAACCFTSPQNYTTFKPIQDMADAPLSLCTHTKLHYSQTEKCSACFFCALYPYKITLLSNGTEQFINATTALYPYKITLLSNNKSCIVHSK